MVITYDNGKDQPGKVANPARGQLNREKCFFFISPFVPDSLVSRDGFGSPVPRQPSHLYTQPESGAYLRDSFRFPRQPPFIYLDRQTPSGQSRVYRVTQLRTDGVHCRESAGKGPVNLKVVPVTGAAILQVAMDQLICASLSHTHYRHEVCMVITYSRVWINRVRLPILLVVS